MQPNNAMARRTELAPRSTTVQRATIQRRYDFEAAHRLPHVPDGHKCKNMHGHSYQVVVQVTGPVQQRGPERGMIVDFGALDAAAAMLKAEVDHSTLNATLHDNPTVEEMVPLVWDHFFTAMVTIFGLPRRLPKAKRWVLKVWLYEGPRSCAVCPPEE